MKFCEKCSSEKYVKKHSKANMYLCSKCKYYFDKYGCFENPYSKSKVVKKDNYYMLELFNAKNEVVDYALVDKIDVEFVSKHRWIKHTYYAYNSKLGFLHRLINKTPSGFVTDHINKNKLDNRRNNLRTATKSENAINVDKAMICYDKARNKWTAYSEKINGKRNWQKRFSTKEEAERYVISMKEV